MLQFNVEISKERQHYLRKDSNELQAIIQDLSKELLKLNNQREDALKYLYSTNSYKELKILSTQLVTIDAKIQSLIPLIELYHKRQIEINRLEDQKLWLSKLEQDLLDSISEHNVMLQSIKDNFRYIIKYITDRHAEFIVRLNKEKNIEFEEKFIDDTGINTWESDGNSYKKLMCVAFDLSLINSHLSVKYPHFIFHDGIFESIDDRKKEKLLDIISDYCDKGMQNIITLIDSDIPSGLTVDDFFHEKGKIILSLCDENDNGLLFKGIRW